MTLSARRAIAGLLDFRFRRARSGAEGVDFAAAPLGRVLGPPAPRDAGSSILAIADAAGATLQINLLRPLAKAVTAGGLRLQVFTEEDERLALGSGFTERSLVEALWRQSLPQLVFVSRYGGGLAEEILAQTQRSGTPLVYHLDDNLFEVPPEAGTAKARKYGDPQRQSSMRALLRQASVAYISTGRLAEQLREGDLLSGPTMVGEIASASDPLQAPRAGRTRTGHFGYMASSSHAPDLALALPGIVNALRAREDLRFTVFGSLRPPPELETFGRRVNHVGAVPDYDRFLATLAEMDWDWGLSPLRPGRFNEAKTDTKWVEYAAAGIPCLVSRHPVYESCLEDGAAVAVADEEWGEILPRVLADEALAARTAAAARDRLVRRHGLDRMAEQLAVLFRRAGVGAAAASLFLRGPTSGIGADTAHCQREGNSDMTAPNARGQAIPGIDHLPDDELERLNQLLPWAAFVLDGNGRRFGAAYSPEKRNVAQEMPDPRIVDLDRRVPLADLTVLEMGCFEGIHTTALAQRAKRVLACDSRIENVVKTIVRCAMYGFCPQVFRWDAEEAPPPGIDLGCDVLHHVGLLYHLTDPVGHLSMLLPHVRKAVMLDTQIAPEDGEASEYDSQGRSYRYVRYREAGRAAPFAGMRDHAKWLFKDDVVAVLREAGFGQVEIASLRQERNGPRLLLYATR